MPRSFCIPGIVILFIAFVLSFLVAISLPFLPALDFVRIQVPDGFRAQGGEGIKQFRFGIWAPCFYDVHDTRSCFKAGVGYIVSLQNSNKDAGIIIGASWTRGLAIHPVATVVTFAAFAMSFSSHLTVTLLASITSFLAAFITLLAFAVDIALYAYVKHQVKKLPNTTIETVTAPAFWLTFVTFILLLIAGCIVCFGRRKDRMAGATSTSYPAYSTQAKTSWLQRFKK